MKRKKWFSLGAAYCRHHAKALFLFGVLMGVMFLVYGLYRLPWGPVVYTALLMAALALGMGAMGFAGYCRRLARLELLTRQAADQLGDFPAPRDRLEEQYQALAKGLTEQYRTAQEAHRRQLADAARYYTLWSHQVKTPLAAMGLLLEEEEPDRGTLAQELLKTQQYVDMALQYQRLESPTRDLLLRTLPLEGLVSQAIKRTAPLFIHKKLTLELEPFHRLVLTDEKWLVFVLEQLLTNAVKYTPQGGVRIGLEPGTATILVVEDTGIGIREQDLPRVFEWGYTGCNGRGEQRSTGIGLFLCREALELLGHSIAITSQVGRGTRVALDLSREQLEAD